jgi:phosphatidylglycerol:prolipoprotein diacylglycerol transferase
MIFAGPAVLRLPFWAWEISYYRLFLALALAVTLVATLIIVRRRGLPWRPSVVTLLSSALGFLVGARLFNVAIRPDLYLAQPWRLTSLDASGLSLYGGLLAAALCAWLVARRVKLDIWRFGDASAPALGLGLAIMRIGCFVNGCCFGKPTHLPWGVDYPLLGNAHLWQMAHGFAGLFEPLAVHPTQLYEAIYALLGAGLALWLHGRKTRPGTPLLVFILWLTTFRLANHFLRALPYDPLVTNIVYPAFYMAIILVCIGLLYKKRPLES